AEDEKKRILFDFNDTAAEYPVNKTIHQLFVEQVEQNLDRIALVGATAVETLRATSLQTTYRQLNEQSDRLAGMLIEKGVMADTIVGILMERSIEMVIGIFGILKTGGAYMPIDPDYPQERIDYMLKDSGAKLLGVANELEGKKVRRWEVEKVVLESILYDSNHLKGCPRRGLHHSIHSPSNLAYIIYTSGTTGQPKGSLIEHRNVVRLMFNDKFQFDFTYNDVWTLFHSFCFDFSVWEMYGALLYGGKLVIVPKMTARDTAAFLGILTRETVSVLNQTPSAFYNLINECLGSHQREEKVYLKYIIFGGEALNPAKLKEWLEIFPKTRLVNMFGITETTVHVTYKEITEKDIVLNISNIGKPIPTLSAYIVDKYLKPVPVGVAGEIIVGGKGVCRGYLNRVELTERKFIENPYKQGDLMYRSGDTGRYLENGEMEYLGRIDQQVKIRGFRIELGEIENRLLKYDGIKDTVVLAEEKGTEKYLCAYIVSAIELVMSELRDYLSKELPDYMIPSYFVRLDRIPLTPNGKIDRSALPGIGGSRGLLQEYAPPTTETEEKLAELWESVLGIKGGINLDFFHSGGDSIKAVRLVNAINTKLSSDLIIADIYLNKTIKKLADIIDRKKAVPGYSHDRLDEAVAEIEALRNRVMSDSRLPDGIEDVYPMSDIQKGMVFHSLKDRKAAVYHDQMIFQPIISGFNKEIFKKAFVMLVEKHSLLKTAFDLDTYEEPMQLVYRKISYDIEHYDISSMPKKEQEDYLLRFLVEDREKVFEINTPPLWRLRTFDTGNDRICGVLIFHHAIMDGWSIASLTTEVMNTYWQLKSNPAFTPVMLKNSYKAYIIEQAVEKKRSDVADFWRIELEGYNRLELPNRFRKEDRKNIAQNYNHKLGNDLLSKLQDISRSYRSTVKNLCFDAYLYMLNMLSYENEMTVGLVTNNRPLCEDGDKILGCFLNTIPVRIKIPAKVSWVDYIKLVDKKLLELKKYERIPLFDIVKIIGENTQDRNPIFDVMFNFIDFHVFGQIEQDYGKDNTGKLYVEGNLTTNILLDFTVSATSGEFELFLSYSDEGFDEETVKNLCCYFQEVLDKFIAEPGSIAYKVELIPVEERKKLLEEFNDTNAEYPKDKTIHELFAEQAENSPDRIALVGAGSQTCPITITLSYNELNDQADRLAGLLIERGVRTDNIVG
ncbi:MAG: hypothetical protein QG657_3972, partial [Acidobacteriota bacterium]|nr:hypothetical protein [Acidobacteriota bacterium]